MTEVRPICPDGRRRKLQTLPSGKQFVFISKKRQYGTLDGDHFVYAPEEPPAPEPVPLIEVLAEPDPEALDPNPPEPEPVDEPRITLPLSKARYPGGNYLVATRYWLRHTVEDVSGAFDLWFCAPEKTLSARRSGLSNLTASTYDNALRTGDRVNVNGLDFRLVFDDDTDRFTFVRLSS